MLSPNRLEYLRGCRLVELEGECRRRLEALRECMAVCWFEPFRVPFGMAMKGYVVVMESSGKDGRGKEGMQECLSGVDIVRNALQEAGRIRALGRGVFTDMVEDLLESLDGYVSMVYQEFPRVRPQAVVGCDV